MKIRKKIGNLVEKSWPMTINDGPPLPQGLRINWPDAIRNKMPDFIFNLSMKTEDIQSSLERKIRGY